MCLKCQTEAPNNLRCSRYKFCSSSYLFGNYMLVFSEFFLNINQVLSCSLLYTTMRRSTRIFSNQIMNRKKREVDKIDKIHVYIPLPGLNIINLKANTFDVLLTAFDGLELQMVCFTLKQLKAATKNFDNVNKIGEGGFGPVYKVHV